MNRRIAWMAGSIIAAGLAFGAWAHDGKHPEKDAAIQATVIGELIDTACYVSSGGEEKGKEHASCARKCLASGVPAGILPQDSKDANGIMFLLTNPKPLAPHAGKTIKVEGRPHPNLHAFDVKKLYVQNGSQWTEVQLQDEHHGATEGGHKGQDGHGDHHNSGHGSAEHDRHHSGHHDGHHAGHKDKQPPNKSSAGQRQR